MKFDESIGILCVDDDDIDIESLRRSFRKNNIRNKLLVAHDGVEALEILRSNDPRYHPRPKIALVDINMPRMNGLELLVELRKDRELRDMMVFMLTTSNQMSDVTQATVANAAGYIVKPATAAGLHEAIARLERVWQLCQFPNATAA